MEYQKNRDLYKMKNMNKNPSLMKLKPSLIWTFSDQLTIEQKESWNQLVNITHDKTASCFLEFTIRGLSLDINNMHPFFALAYRDHQLKMALLLTRQDKKIGFFSWKQLSIVSHNHLDCMTLLNDPDESFIFYLKSLKLALKKHSLHWDSFFSRRIRLTLKQKNSLNDSEWVNKVYQKKSDFFDLKNKKALNEVLPKKLLKNILRLEKKISKEKLEYFQEAELFNKTSLNNMTLIAYSQKKDILNALDIFFHLEKSGWKGKKGSAIACDPLLLDFYQKNWFHFSKKGYGYVFVLTFKEKAIASAIVFRSNHALILHKIAFHDKLRAYGSGSILIKYLVDYSLKDPFIDSIHFNTHPTWLKRWHPQSDSLVALQFFNSSFKGRFIEGVFKSFLFLKQTKRKIKGILSYGGLYFKKWYYFFHQNS
jgi:hypothetical protein